MDSTGHSCHAPRQSQVSGVHSANQGSRAALGGARPDQRGNLPRHMPCRICGILPHREREPLIPLVRLCEHRAIVVARAYDHGMRILSLLISLAIALPLAACGVQESLPAEAVPADTAIVVRADPAKMQSAMIRDAIEAVAGIARKSTNPQIVQFSGLAGLQVLSMEEDAEDAKATDAAMASLVDAGATAIWVVIPESALSAASDLASDAAEGDADSLFEYGTALVQAKTRDAGPAIEKALRAMDDDLAACTATPLAPGWFAISATADQKRPAGGDAAMAKSFASAIDRQSGASMAMAMRMTDSMRAALSSDDEAMLQAQMMVGRVVSALERLQMLSASVTFGKDPAIRARMAFGSDGDAAEFNSAWDETLQTILGFIQMQSMMAAEDGEGGDAPQPKPVQWGPLFDGLKMRQEGAALSLTLDQERMRSMMK